MEKVLIAGSTGYLGKYLVKELKKQGYFTVALARNEKKLSDISVFIDKVTVAEVTKPETLRDICKDVNIVISSLGITRQKDGLTYMDVDYQGNMNILKEAKKQGVRKFIYVSVFHGDKLRNLQICDAKERFVDELTSSGLDYCIIRPNGFFSDMAEFYQMAIKGRIYLFGDGSLKANPIHGKDLAEICIGAIKGKNKQIEAGGPETLTQNEIAQVAFEAAGKKMKITYIPDWVRRFIKNAAKLFMSNAKYGPVEFFLTVMAKEAMAPEYGTHTLKEFYNTELK